MLPTGNKPIVLLKAKLTDSQVVQSSHIWNSQMVFPSVCPLGGGWRRGWV